MTREILLDDEHAFIHRLRELVEGGVAPSDIQVYTPLPVPEADEILKYPPSFVRVFAVLGALTGALTGFALTGYSVYRWQMLVTGGKWGFTVLPFAIIAFELTILFGALATFGGFLLLARLPYVPTILQPVEYGNRFAIVLKETDPSESG